MKNNWIKLSEKMPIINEIIYYKGNIYGQRARHIGNGKVQLPDGTFDDFDEWKPKALGFVTFRIFHIDGTTKIEAQGVVEDGLFVAEYIYKGMTYGATIPLGNKMIIS
jgi:hypothetical protein